ncbi:hypothetical protein ACLOJK_022347 [Asimina triloba]
MSAQNRARDPAIKLFGMMIPLLPNAVAGDRPEVEEIVKEEGDKGGGKGDEKEEEEEEEDEEQQEEAEDETEEMTEKDPVNADTREIKDAEQPSPVSVDELSEPTSLSSKTNESFKTHPGDKDTNGAEDEDQSGAGNSKDKTPKKPDKILPCPRCNSLETKFCYFNNYNINQPRHFCKNCQRYWTAGGTMRNVPVGAGRRKNKSSASRYLQAAQADAPEAIHRVPLKTNGTVLTFGMDAPLCESMASVLNLADKSMRIFHHMNGFHGAEDQRMAVSLGAENGEELSSGSSVTASTCSDKNTGNQPDPAVRNGQVFPPQMPFFGGAPWPYPWNSAHWGSPMPPPPPPPPPFYPSTLPIPFYPATPYWACTVPGTWSVPWGPPPSSAHNAASGGGSNSPRLGKHPREGEPLKEWNEEKDDGSKQSSSERCLWIPKTLRIDDPGEAARSSIFATLGIKNDPSSGGGLFNAFQSKQDNRNHTAEASQVLQANPAALSRSRKFHESS